ncbi:MAG: hypothetical protein IJ874_10695 [Ruminococcus sp.]|nr:hypothetical protein [Ruminococcus sp.]
MELKKGTVLTTIQGCKVTVDHLIGDGGQGRVYLVDYAGTPKAMKIYHETYQEKMAEKGTIRGFYDNLRRNASNAPPARNFVWIDDVLKWDGDPSSCFGYIMELIPDNYKELTEFYNAYGRGTTLFPSYHEMFRACINITEGFRALHNNGYSYQDVNNGNFFIDPETGDVLICDNDNVSVNKTNFGLGGKMRYMAPEVVLGANPDRCSDRFSLAVVLFRLLFRRQHPFEGKYTSVPCMTPKREKLFYGSDPVFLFDKDDNRNSPIPQLNKAVMVLWPRYPDYIRQLFMQTFSKNGIKNPERRPADLVWLIAFSQLDACTVRCHDCGRTVFLEAENSVRCSKCGKLCSSPVHFINNNYELPVVPGSQITEFIVDDTTKNSSRLYFELVRNSAGVPAVKNCSDDLWSISYKSGRMTELKGGEEAEFEDGMDIMARGTHIELKVI